MNEDQLRTILNQELAGFFGQVSQHVDKRIDELRGEINAVKADVDRVHTAVDGLAKDIVEDRQERTAMNTQLDRHEAWIERAAPKLYVSYDQAA